MKFPHWLCLCFCLLIQQCLSAAGLELQVSKLTQIDPDATWTQLENSAVSGEPLSQELPRSAAAFTWYRVQISSLPPEPVLVVRNAFAAGVIVRLPEAQLHQRRGEWPIPDPQFSQINMVFDLSRHRATNELFIGVAKPVPQSILLSMYSRPDYIALDTNGIRLLNGCLGVLIAFSALGFAFFWVERDQTALLFAGTLLLQWFYFSFMYGEAAFLPGLGWLWPRWIEITTLAAVLSVILYGEVYGRLIDLPQSMPRLMRIIRLLYIWCGAIILVTLLDWLLRTGERSAVAASVSFSGNFLVVLVSTLLFVGMIWSCIRRQPLATIVLLASLVSTSGSVLRASEFAFGWVGLEWAWSMHVLGIAISGSLMTVALTRRFLGLRDERDQARNLATHDPLTGALNRLGGMTHANVQFAKARTNKLSFCVAILDLDHFKQVNDRFGHPVGDAALKLFARLAKDNLAGDERLLRLGGEEFVLLLPGSDQQRALHRVNTLRLSVQQAGLEIDGQPVRLTVSIGVAELRADHRSVDALINDADQALYAAKRTGRNRALVFDPTLSTGASPDELTSPA